MGKSVDMSNYQDAQCFRERAARLAWSIVWTVFARPIPRAMLSGWKRFLLRLFGAKISSTAIVYSGTKIYAPWNLEMGDHSTMAAGVDCYCADKVVIGKHCVISQKASLYTASHDITTPDFKWFSAPITIGDGVWIAAESFITLGVTIGEGAVVGARAAVFKDVEPWTVVGGNPARILKKRELR